MPLIKKPVLPKTRPTIISKSSGKTVDRTRSLAARKAAATRRSNAQQAVFRRQLRLRHKVFAVASISMVIVLTVFGVKGQFDSAYAATASTKTVTVHAFVNGNGRCLDNDHSHSTSGNAIQIWTCNETGAQDWSNGAQIRNANGSCMGVASTTAKSGTMVTLKFCTTDPSGEWTFSKGTIINKKSKLCVEPAYDSNANGADLHIIKCNGKKSQQWTYKTMTKKVSGSSSNGSSSSSSSSKSSTAKKPTSTKPVATKKPAPVKKPSAAAGTYGNSDKRSLAKAILASGKVSFIGDSDSISAGDQRAIFSDIADGRTTGNSLPCGINIKVLRLMKLLVDTHSSVGISDTNSLCVGYNARSIGSRHYGGNGSAIDVYMLDGVDLDGGNSKSIQYLNQIKGMLDTGSTLHTQSQVGQVQCRDYINLGHVIQYDDSCNHVHVDFPPWDDPNLQHKSYAY